MSEHTTGSQPCPHLLVGVTGSIHALDIYHYLERFQASLAEQIKVIMTQNATRMIDPKTVELYADDRVFVDFWDRSPSVQRIPHIQLARWADLFVIVPATADIIGKAANGIADDLLSTTILSYTGTIVFVPAMNKSMWQNKALQRNRRLLEEDGHYFVPPEEGVALGTGEREAVSSFPESVLTHLQHVRMKQLQRDYWEEATSTKPLTPAEKMRQQRDQRQRIAP